MAMVLEREPNPMKLFVEMQIQSDDRQK